MIVLGAACEADWFIASVTNPSASATAARAPAITIPRRWTDPVTLVLSADTTPFLTPDARGPRCRGPRAKQVKQCALRAGAGGDRRTRAGLLVDRRTDRR